MACVPRINNNFRGRKGGGRSLSFIFPLEPKPIYGSTNALDNISFQLNEPAAITYAGADTRQEDSLSRSVGKANLDFFFPRFFSLRDTFREMANYVLMHADDAYEGDHPAPKLKGQRKVQGEDEDDWREFGWMDSLPEIGLCRSAGPFDPAHFGDLVPGLLPVPAAGERLSVLQWDRGSGWTCVRNEAGAHGFVPTHTLVRQERKKKKKERF